MNAFTLKSENDLDNVARSILKMHNGPGVFALYGKMGSGKTTLIKAFCRVLNCQEPATSPTFAIVNEYRNQAGQKIFHFDFYRIETAEEVFDLGYEEYFYDDKAYVFIEWPEMTEELLPENHTKIRIRETENARRIINVE